MRPNTCSRPFGSSRLRKPFRRSLHRGLHHAPRRAVRNAIRQIIPFCGRDFHQAVVEFERALKITQKAFAKTDPGWRQNRFRTACSQEEADRRVEEDLKRAYGTEAVARRATETERPSPNGPASKPPAGSSDTIQPPAQSHKSASPQSQHQKPDIIQVPLPRHRDDLTRADSPKADRLASLLFTLFFANHIDNCPIFMG